MEKLHEVVVLIAPPFTSLVKEGFPPKGYGNGHVTPANTGHMRSIAVY